jgi:hypothetical protein
MIYQANCDRLMGLIDNSLMETAEEINNVTVTLATVAASLHQLNIDIAAKTAIDPQKIVDDAAAQLNATTPLTTKAVKLITSRFFLYNWMTVMLVTFAEAYLQDALDALVSAGLSGSALAEEVTKEIKRKWIRDILRSGRPHEWITWLKRLGVTGYTEGLADEMKMVWERRHRIVHSPGSGANKFDPKEFAHATEIINGFVEATDALVRACPIMPVK